MEKIKDLQKLLKTFLDENATNIECDIKPLQIECENYGSVMLELTVKYVNGTKEETLNVVAKVRPESEYLKRVFPLEVCFKNEINVYKIIFPYLKKFQISRSLDIINFIPHCYAARTSLKNNDEEIDDDVVLLLENLKLKGYRLVDRTESFDLRTSLHILKNLATFHAVSLALKLLEPELFQEHVINKLAIKVKFNSLSKESEDKVLQLALRATSNDNLARRVEKALHYYFNTYKKPFTPHEPFATLIHNDFWITNILFRHENEEVVSSKIIDFQRVEYGSPARDILFFLFTSVKLEVLDSHYQSFIKHYYDNFIEVLEKFKCDTTPFSFKAFEEEIRLAAATKEFYHIILMVQYVHANKNEKEINENYTEADHFSRMQITDACLARLKKTIEHFAKNNWI